MSLKLRELWNECEKLEPDAFNVFVEGLAEIHKKRSPGAYDDTAKPCVAKPTGGDRQKWTPAEEDLLHKCCQNTSVVNGVRIFREKTGYKRTQGACELRANEMKRKGRW